MTYHKLSYAAFSLTLAALLAFSSSPFHENNAEAQAVQIQRIGLVYTAPHEITNQVVRGFRDGLAEALPKGSYEVIERHASGDRTQFSATVEAVLAQRPAVIAPMTTPISQIVLQNKPR